MPHSNIPEGWAEYIIAAIAAMIGWIVRHTTGRVVRLEKRVAKLETNDTIAEERHQANLDRLDRIEESTDRIDSKLDRLIERR